MDIYDDFTEKYNANKKNNQHKTPFSCLLNGRMPAAGKYAAGERSSSPTGNAFFGGFCFAAGLVSCIFPRKVVS